jgi:hypothetical protein
MSATACWESRAAGLCRRGLLRLPGGHRLVLREIEAALLADDLRLGSEFAIFTRDARRSAMPPTERVRPWPWPQHLNPALLTGGLAVACGALLIGLAPGRKV